MRITIRIPLVFLVGCSGVLAQIGPNWHGGMQGEGYSSISPEQPLELQYRMFTTTSTECEGVTLPARFEVSPTRVALRVGDRFSVDDLILRAVDARGTFLARSPITASIFYEPGVLGQLDLQVREFVASRPGHGVVIFQGVCRNPGQPVRLEVPVIVED
jgi:hypothetical protein